MGSCFSSRADQTVKLMRHYQLSEGDVKKIFKLFSKVLDRSQGSKKEFTDLAQSSADGEQIIKLSECRAVLALPPSIFTDRLWEIVDRADDLSFNFAEFLELMTVFSLLDRPALIGFGFTAFNRNENNEIEVADFERDIKDLSSSFTDILWSQCEESLKNSASTIGKTGDKISLNLFHLVCQNYPPLLSALTQTQQIVQNKTKGRHEWESLRRKLVTSSKYIIDEIGDRVSEKGKFLKLKGKKKDWIKLQARREKMREAGRSQSTKNVFQSTINLQSTKHSRSNEDDAEQEVEVHPDAENSELRTGHETKTKVMPLAKIAGKWKTDGPSGKLASPTSGQGQAASPHQPPSPQPAISQSQSQLEKKPLKSALKRRNSSDRSHADKPSSVQSPHPVASTDTSNTGPALLSADNRRSSMASVSESHESQATPREESPMRAQPVRTLARSRTMAGSLGGSLAANQSSDQPFVPSPLSRQVTNSANSQSNDSIPTPTNVADRRAARLSRTRTKTFNSNLRGFESAGAKENPSPKVIARASMESGFAGAESGTVDSPALEPDRRMSRFSVDVSRRSMGADFQPSISVSPSNSRSANISPFGSLPASPAVNQARMEEFAALQAQPIPSPSPGMRGLGRPRAPTMPANSPLNSSGASGSPHYSRLNTHLSLVQVPSPSVGNISRMNTGFSPASSNSAASQGASQGQQQVQLTDRDSEQKDRRTKNRESKGQDSGRKRDKDGDRSGRRSRSSSHRDRDRESESGRRRIRSHGSKEGVKGKDIDSLAALVQANLLTRYQSVGGYSAPMMPPSPVSPLPYASPMISYGAPLGLQPSPSRSERSNAFANAGLAQFGMQRSNTFLPIGFHHQGIPMAYSATPSPPIGQISYSQSPMFR